jgi:hypothetical protein
LGYGEAVTDVSRALAGRFFGRPIFWPVLRPPDWAAMAAANPETATPTTP